MNALQTIGASNLAPLLIGIAVGAIFLLVGFAIASGRRRRMVTLPGPTNNLGELPPSLRRIDTDSTIPTLDRAVKRWLPRRQALRERLSRTGRNINAGQFILFCLVLFFCAALVLIRVVGLSPALALPLAFIVGAGVPYFITGIMGRRRLDRFNHVFPDAIDIIVRGLKAGTPIQDSLSVVANEVSDPVGSEFRIIEQAVTIGQPLDEALADAGKRVKTQEFQFFVISLALQRETGGNLAETLENLSDILRRRRQIRLKIRAMSSEARASAIIIGTLPFLMFGIILLINTQYAMRLLTDPRGIIMLCAGLFSIVVGVGIMFKMMRFEI